jgi:hypothetical protein
MFPLGSGAFVRLVFRILSNIPFVAFNSASSAGFSGGVVWSINRLVPV